MTGDLANNIPLGQHADDGITGIERNDRADSALVEHLGDITKRVIRANRDHFPAFIIQNLVNRHSILQASTGESGFFIEALYHIRRTESMRKTNQAARPSRRHITTRHASAPAT